VPAFLADQYIWMLAAVMLVAGVLGGTVNHFVTHEADAPKLTLSRALLVGITASFMVPLFLNMISSDLLEQVRGDTSKLLVFGGFCLIAAVSSRAFTRTVPDRILHELKQAKSEAAEAKLEAGRALQAAQEVGTRFAEAQRTQAELGSASRQSVEPAPTTDIREVTTMPIDMDERERKYGTS
jgi:hypothetical protein